MNRLKNMLMSVLVAILPTIAILFSSILFLIMLSIWWLMSNYNYCSLPFEKECWNPDEVYYDNPIREEEITSLVAHMEETRKSLSDKGVSNFTPYYMEVPVYDANKIEEADSEKFHLSGLPKKKEGETDDGNGKDESKVESVANVDSADDGAGSGEIYKITTQPEDTPQLRENLKAVLGNNVTIKGRSNKFRTNLDHYVDVLIEASKKEGIDPRFVVAIMVHETGYGTAPVVHYFNNTGGIVCVNIAAEFEKTGCGKTPGGTTNWSIFASMDGSMKFKANFLRRLYVDQGLITVPQVGAKYAPIGAANDPNNLNANWVPNTGRVLRALGVTEDIGVAIEGVLDLGGSYSNVPDLGKYEKMKVRKVKLDNGMTKNVGVKELNEKQLESLKKWFGTGDEETWNKIVEQITNAGDASVSEAELHLKTLIQMDMEGTINTKVTEYETAHAFLRVSRELDSEDLFADVALSEHKKAFIKWAKDLGYDKKVKYENEDELIEKLLLKNFTSEKYILENAPKDELVYPLIVHYLDEIPKSDKFTGEEAKKNLDKIIKDENLDEYTLSVLAIGHYMKRQAFEEFTRQYQDDFGGFAYFDKAIMTDVFEQYVKKEKEKAEINEETEGNLEKVVNKNNEQSWWENAFSDVVSLVAAPGEWAQGSYFDMKVKGNTMIRFGIYNSTNEIMEIGSYSRTLCFFTEPYAVDNPDDFWEETKQFGKDIGDAIGNILPGNVEEDKYGAMGVEDFCGKLNQVAYEKGKMKWEESQVLNKTTETYNLSFYCERLPEEEITAKRKEYEEAEKRLKEEAERKKAEEEAKAGKSEKTQDATDDDIRDEVYRKKMEELMRGPAIFGSLDKPLAPTVAGEFGEFTKELVPVENPYDISGPKVGIFDALDDVQSEIGEGKAENVYEEVDEAYNSVASSGTVGIKDERGVVMGKIDSNGENYSVEWIDYEKNAKKSLVVSPTTDCEGNEYKDPDYGFSTHKPSYKYTSSVEPYYQTPWEAFAMSENFALHFTTMKKDMEKKGNTMDSELFKTKVIQQFFEQTNIDESLDKDWKKEMGEWLTGKMVSSDASPPGSGTDRVLDPKEYEGMEFQLPVAPGGDGKITISSGFGWRTLWGGRDYHEGLDFVGATDILAVADGTVEVAGWQNPGNHKEGYGQRVRVKHVAPNGNTFYTVYAHLSAYNVSAGQKVTRGQAIGKMGTTGSSTGVHLHFDISIGNSRNRVNPVSILGLNASNTKCQPTASNCPAK